MKCAGFKVRWEDIFFFFLPWKNIYTIWLYWTADIQLICIILSWQEPISLNASDNRYYSIREKRPPCSLQQYQKGRKCEIREIKMTPESFEWGVILHLERQPGKLRQKGKKMPLSHQLPLKIYKWSVNRNEFLWGFRHHLLRGERDQEKKEGDGKDWQIMLIWRQNAPHQQDDENVPKVSARCWHVNIFHELFYGGMSAKNFLGCLFRMWIATPR